MFFTYLGKELRGRRKQTAVVALGLAFGIALVVVVSAMASGVKDAQGDVLHSLYGVGTDITVTQTATPGTAPGGFQVGGGGDTFQRDRLVSGPGQAAFSATRVASVAEADGVAAAAGGLQLSAMHIAGDLPTFGDPGTAQGPDATAPIDPGQIDVSSFSVAGLDVTITQVGPLAADQVSAGRALTASDAEADVAVLDKAYAKQQGLAPGDSIEIAGAKFEVVGLATTTAEGAGYDVYIPLGRAQDLADLSGKVNTIYIRAESSSSIPTAAKAIRRAFPDATVSTASDLAAQTSGSLSSAANLSTKLGVWLSVAVLVAAIVVASLLTLSAVGRRTRELGTLKALGWRTRRVVGQIMGETVVQCLIGGVLGLTLGLVGAWLLTQLAPSLTAGISTFALPGSGPAGPAGGGGNQFTRSVSVALHAPVSPSLIALAIGLSLVGGLIAGTLGGWRAARLRPADAMRRLV